MKRGLAIRRDAVATEVCPNHSPALHTPGPHLVDLLSILSSAFQSSTKGKALFVNPAFILGSKKEESGSLLGLLFDRMAKGADFHERAAYRPGSVVWVSLVPLCFNSWL